MVSYATALPTAAAMITLGAWPLTAAADAILKKKHTSMSRHWNEMLKTCASDTPKEGYAAQWLKRQRVALASGKLCRERACALEDAGLVKNAGDIEKLSSIAEERESYSFSPSLTGRIASALLASAIPLVLALGGHPIELVVLGSLLGLILAVIVICDMRARIIPYQTCIAYGIVALAWVVVARGLWSLIPSAILGLAALIVLAVSEKTAVKVTLSSAIGTGDRRLFPLTCLQVGLVGLIPGLFALCVVAGLMAIIALAKGADKRSYLPFAPAIYAFAAMGTIWPNLPLPW